MAPPVEFSPKKKLTIKVRYKNNKKSIYLL